jgi:hypothetical protein
VAAGALSDGGIESSEDKEGADSGSDENELYGENDDRGGDRFVDFQHFDHV